MARNAWIPLAFGGIGSVLLISGIQGESLSQVFKGEFGKGTSHPTPNPAYKGGPGPSEEGSGALPTITTNPFSTLGLISPFPKGHEIIWGRSDQGVDGLIAPGTPLRAMGNGTIEIAHNCAGFGCDYPVIHLDNGESFYYGHTAPIVGSGTRVKKGEVIAVIPPNGQGNATTPGSFEIGQWPPGSTSQGNVIRNWFINLPRE